MDTALWLLFLFLHILSINTVAGEPQTSPNRPDTSCRSTELAAQLIRREGYAAIDKADEIREQAYRVMEEALEMKESALEAKSALESVLVEAITLFRSQSSATNVYIQEIRTTLGDIEDKIGDLEDKIEGVEDRIEGVEDKLEGVEDKIEGVEDKLEGVEDKIEGVEDKIEGVEDKIEGVEQRIGQRFDKQDETLEESFAGLNEQTTGLDEKIAEQGKISSSISESVADTLSTAQTLKARQEVQITEIRLISLYKITGSNNQHSNHDEGVIVDGMVTFDRPHWGDMSTYSHSAGSGPGYNLWVELGGLFKIHSIKIWNLRHCCAERLVGTQVYVDDTIVGTVVHSQRFYDFAVDGVYGTKVELVQPLSLLLHIIELQVWGTGPYAEDDRFS